MKQLDRFQGKKVLVLGLAKSGYAASQLLLKLGATVVVNDKQKIAAPTKQDLESLGITVIDGHHPVEMMPAFDLVVKNPGIPYSNPMLIEGTNLGLDIITEVEIAYLLSDAPFIGVTGSNGKTTTTTLIFDMLEVGQKKPLIAGNIGTVACEVAQTATSENYIVTELSSFQLLGTKELRPKISVFLNLTEAHLDYHGTMAEYGHAKANIFLRQQPEDYAIINVDDPIVAKLAEKTNATIIPISTEHVVEKGAYLQDGFVCFRREKIIPINDIVLPGVHNLQNIAAAVSAAKLVGVSNEAIREVLTTFSGVKHRTQYVTTVQGRKFYNDSKATNTFAAKVALRAFNAPTIWLAGGLDRGTDFDEMIPALKHVKAAIFFGETATRLAQTAEKARVKEVHVVPHLTEGTKLAYHLSVPGDVILLSPACASWDQFATFEERGDIFIDTVHKLV